MTEHPLTHVRNVGLYRLQVITPSTTGMHWQIQKGGGFHYAEAEKRMQTLPLAVVIGADPYLLMAAINARTRHQFRSPSRSGVAAMRPLNRVPGLIGWARRRPDTLEDNSRKHNRLPEAT